jgi:hypothetical protein
MAERSAEQRLPGLIAAHDAIQRDVSARGSPGAALTKSACTNRIVSARPRCPASSRAASTYAVDAATAIRAFGDKDLDRAVPVSLYGDAELTCQFVLEDHAVRHSAHHLARLRTPAPSASGPDS